MRYLPVFLDATAGPILLVGEGEAARAKLRLLEAAGATVRWYDTADGATTPERVAAQPSADGGGSVTRVAGDPLTAPLDGVIAVFCAGAGELGPRLAARARAAGLPVNVMDDLAHSSFIVPAIVDRGDVVVAVGTGGAAPVLARRLRERIEALLPARIGDLAGFVGRWRADIATRIPPGPLRRRFWERIVDGPVGASVIAGRASEADAVLRAIADPADYAARGGAATGFVTLVGAGPGDPDLLTIKALRALQDADVVFYDELVTPGILDRVRRDAVREPVGRRIGKPGIGQDAINRKLIAAARAGQRVVRLKGGDPFVFGRGGEEIAALREAGIDCAVIPGITAALGAAAETQTPLTFRQEALRVTFLTAHKVRDAEAVDWSALTDRQMTVVIYMGMTAAPAIRAGLLRAGRPANTPVGVFARATRPDAATVVGTLEDLPALASRVDFGPAILIVGDVVAHARAWPASSSGQLLDNLLAAAE